MDTTQQGDSAPPSAQNDHEEALLATSGEPEKHQSEAPPAPSELEGSDLTKVPETNDSFLTSLNNPITNQSLPKPNLSDGFIPDSQHAIVTSNSTLSLAKAPVNIEASPTVARSQASTIRLPSLFSPTELSVRAEWKDAAESMQEHSDSSEDSSEIMETATVPAVLDVAKTDLHLDTPPVQEEDVVNTASSLETSEEEREVELESPVEEEDSSVETVEEKKEAEAESDVKVETLPVGEDNIVLNTTFTLGTAAEEENAASESDVKLETSPVEEDTSLETVEKQGDAGSESDGNYETLPTGEEDRNMNLTFTVETVEENREVELESPVEEEDMSVETAEEKEEAEPGSDVELETLPIGEQNIVLNTTFTLGTAAESVQEQDFTEGSVSDSEAETSVTSVSHSEVPPQVTCTIQNPLVVKLTEDSSYSAPLTTLPAAPEESPRANDTTASSTPSSPRSEPARGGEVSGEDTEAGESACEATMAEMLMNNLPQEDSEVHHSTALIEESETEVSTALVTEPMHDNSLFHNVDESLKVEINSTEPEDKMEKVLEAPVSTNNDAKLEFAEVESKQSGNASIQEDPLTLSETQVSSSSKKEDSPASLMNLQCDIAGSPQPPTAKIHAQEIKYSALPSDPNEMNSKEAEEDGTESVTSASNTLADLCEIDDETADEKSVSEADSTMQNPDFIASADPTAAIIGTQNADFESTTVNFSTMESPIVLNLDYAQPMSIPVTMHFLDQSHMQPDLETACSVNTDLLGGAVLPDSYVQEISDSESSVQEPKVSKVEADDQLEQVSCISEPSESLDDRLNPEDGTYQPDRRYSNSFLTVQGVEALINPQFLQEKLLAWQNQQQSVVGDNEATGEDITALEMPPTPVKVPLDSVSEEIGSDLDENSNLTPKLATSDGPDSTTMPEDHVAHRLLIERQDSETVEIAHVLIDAAIATGILLTEDTESTPYTDMQKVLVPDMIIQGNQHGLAPAFLSSNYQDSEPEGFEDEQLSLHHALDNLPELQFMDKGLKVAGRSAATSVSLDDLSEELKSSNEPLGARFYDKFAQHTESATEFLPPSKQILKDDFEWIDACTSSSELNANIAKPEAIHQKTGIDVYVQQDAIPSIPDTPKPMILPSVASTEADPSVDKMPPVFPKPSVLGAIFGCFRKKNKVKNAPKK